MQSKRDCVVHYGLLEGLHVQALIRGVLSHEILEVESSFLVSRIIELFSDRLHDKSILEFGHSTMLLTLLNVLPDYL